MSSRISVHFSINLDKFYFPPICFAVKPKTHTRHIHPSHRGISHGFVRLIYERHIYRHLEPARKSWKCHRKKGFSFMFHVVIFSSHQRQLSRAHEAKKSLLLHCLACALHKFGWFSGFAIKTQCVIRLSWGWSFHAKFFRLLVTLRHNSFAIQSQVDDI